MYMFWICLCLFIKLWWVLNPFKIVLVLAADKCELCLPENETWDEKYEKDLLVHVVIMYLKKQKFYEFHDYF